MATIDISTAGELLKRLYADWDIQELLNLTNPALSECAREGSAQLGGSGFYFPVRTRGNFGHAYISETDDIPTARRSKVVQATVSPTVQAGVVQLTGLSMAVSSGNAMAFARVFDENVQETLRSMAAYKEGAMFRDGSGLLTQFNGTVPTSAGPHTCDDVAYLRPGMYVDIIDETATTRHNEDLEIIDVDWANRKVTFASSVAAGAADNDRIYIAASQASTGAPVNKEPIGLAGSVLDSGTYLSVDRSAEGAWKSSVITASALFDESLLLRARTRLTQAAGVDIGTMGRSFKVLTHPSQADTLFKLAIPRIRYSGNDSFDLGNENLVSFGGIKFVTSYQCPSNVAYVGDFSYHQSLYTPGGKLHIDTEYNGAQLKWVSSKDAGLVFMKEYCAFANKRPNAFVKIASLTDATR